MCEISLSFRIAVDGERDNIVDIIGRNFKEFQREGNLESRFRLGSNHIGILGNEDYDRVLAKEEEEGYLYYQYHLDFYPVSEKATLHSQIAMARKIKDLLDTEKLPCEIISEFEHLL